MPQSFFAYCSAQWYFWFTFIPFSMTFIEVIIISLQLKWRKYIKNAFFQEMLNFLLGFDCVLMVGDTIKCINNNWFNKFMNLFPLIHKSKKQNHFTNPLNGLIFHSELQPVKKDALSTISYSEHSQTKRNGSNISTLKIKSNYKFKMDRSIQSPERQPHTVVKSSKVLKPAPLFA